MYYGTNPRFNGTYCGQNPTEYDVANRDRAIAWKRTTDGADFWPCLYCSQLRGKK